MVKIGNMLNLVKQLNTTKYANTAIQNAAKTTKCAFTAKALEPKRLFSVNKDKLIGTEIKNNITGTVILRSPGVYGKNITVEPLVTIHRADGRYSGMERAKFEALLNNVEKWNPVIKSDPSIGKELFVKGNPKIEGRYFRASNGPLSHLITKITPERYHSMSLENFDKIILDFLG